MLRLTIVLSLALLAILSSFPGAAFAHCDTMNGPVVSDARKALEKGDITPVLKWIKPGHEAEIREAFAQTLKVRKQGSEARDLADRYFFETLVRIHREGEGAPYTGLKSGEDVEPGIAAADAALEKGSIEDLIRELNSEIAAAVRARYQEAAEAGKHASHNVEAGRHYVEAYVTFIHYVERLHADISGAGLEHQSQGAEVQPAVEHKH